ncbi:MAG: lipocalin-like domain-containing protein [Gammaproteobacteria bacterium]|nr:lipocalin-like domain-containing protein [Gammaproteobacteria bacterium]
MEVIGTWRLVRSSSTSADGTPLPAPFGGPAAMGRVVLGADGRMMAVLCDGRAVVPADETREYTSYCGNYTFDGTTLITRVDAASDPERLGTDQVRDVRFDGELMVLRPPQKAYAGRVEQRELVWEKIAPA